MACLARLAGPLCAALLWLVAALPLQAAEVLQVRSATLLQIGDGNRSYGVELACLQVPPDRREAAADWLRRELPRRERVNLRPTGQHDGQLQARVSRLANGDDLGEGLIAAGLALRQECG